MSTDPNRARIVIAGGSGFLGTALATYLTARQMEVVTLARRAPRAARAWRQADWDGRTLGDWASLLDGAAGLVNLAGRSVDCIKTPANQDEILRSRVEATRVLGQAVRCCAAPPPVWVQMSTAHIYGDPPEVECTEKSPLGVGFAPFVGRIWEEEFGAAVLPTQRQVILRTSFVLGRDRGAGGGALTRLRRLARLGLGGRVGAGRQGFSWIHEADLNRLIERCLSDAEMLGTYIATAPHPVSQAEFMRALRRSLGVPFGLPTPGWLVRIAAPLLMRTDPELALYGRYLRSQRLAEARFEFGFPELFAALIDLVS